MKGCSKIVLQDLVPGLKMCLNAISSAISCLVSSSVFLRRFYTMTILNDDGTGINLNTF